MRLSISIHAVCCALLSLVHAHGTHSEQKERPEDWALWHLQEEHHIDNFDPPSFFTLHDFNNDGVWTPEEVRMMYGLDDESLKDTPASKKQDAVDMVFIIFDSNTASSISKDTFVQLTRQGRKLPDFGLGPGHHGDDEYEYEIHHFEKFHGDDAKLEDLTHPEDIAHFRKHEQMEEEQERIQQEQSHTVVEANIPLKFRVQS